MTYGKNAIVTLLAIASAALPVSHASAEDSETASAGSMLQEQQAALGAKLSEMDALLAGIEENLAKVADLQSRLDELNAGRADSADESAHDSRELRGQLEEALKLFQDRVVPLIAAKVAASVTRELEQKISSLQEPDSSSQAAQDESFTDSVEGIAAALGAAQHAAEQAREAAKEMISAYDLTDTT